MLRPGSLVSRTLAVLILIGVLFAGYRLVVAPVVTAYETTARSIEQSRMLLERYRGIAAQREELAAGLAEHEEVAAESTAYLEGPTGALAAAALQDHVGSVIARSGGELRSTRVLASEPVDEVAGVSRAGLRLDLGVDVEGLERLLYDLESGEPFLFIDQITIREQRSRRRRAEDSPRPMLDVSFEIYGYVRTPEG